MRNKVKEKDAVSGNTITTRKAKVKPGKLKIKTSSMTFGDGNVTQVKRKTIVKDGVGMSREKSKTFAYDKSTGKSKKLMKEVSKSKGPNTSKKIVFTRGIGGRTKIKS